MGLNPSAGELLNNSELLFPHLISWRVKKVEIMYVSIGHNACHIRVLVNVRRQAK